jgi:hypothetical protein
LHQYFFEDKKLMEGRISSAFSTPEEIPVKTVHAAKSKTKRGIDAYVLL